MIKIELKDGSLKEFESGIRAIDVANSISEGLARAIVGAKINGEVKDLKTPINDDAKLEFVKFEDKDGKEVFWHTSTHVMAQAIKRLYPEAKLAIGPAIENGFYYDIDLEHRLSPEDLEKIEAEMKKIVKEEFEVERYELPKDEAIDFMKKLGEDYKVELIEGLEEGSTISFYKQGEFTDLCAGPHLPNVKKVKAFKLLSVAGAYWRADQSNKMLQSFTVLLLRKRKIWMIISR